MAIPNPIPAALSGVKAPIGWAKARPIVFVLLALTIAILAIKFAPKLLALVNKAPVVGPKVVAFAQSGA